MVLFLINFLFDTVHNIEQTIKKHISIFQIKWPQKIPLTRQSNNKGYRQIEIFGVHPIIHHKINIAYRIIGVLRDLNGYHIFILKVIIIEEIELF